MISYSFVIILSYNNLFAKEISTAGVGNCAIAIILIGRPNAFGVRLLNLSARESRKCWQAA